MVRSMEKSQSSWKSRLQPAEKSQSSWKMRQQQSSQRGMKGGYMSEKNMDFDRPQTIEELTGGRLRKK